MPVAVGSTNSSCRDRTSEFHAIAERLRRTPGFSSANVASAEGSSKPQSSQSAQSEFHRRASQIGLGIHQTSQKLQKLTELVRRKTLFDDPEVEIQELTAVLKQDIASLNAAIGDLQELCQARNDRNQQRSSHSVTVVDNLKSRLMSTTKEFKEVLTQRSERWKSHEDRKRIYSASSERRASGTELFGQRRRQNGESSNPGFLQQQSQAQMQQLLPVQDSYMQSRAEALRNIESTIAELSNIFTQLATMVSEQGEIAIRIDENIEETLVNVDNAQGQLLKYLNSISSNRWLIIKIFFVLLVFLLIFVFFVA